MKTETSQNQIIITTEISNEKQKLPANLLLVLAAGAITGVIVIFSLFWGIEILLGL